MGDLTFPDVDITGITADSREVQPGYLFAAFPGAQSDGRTFIREAIERGARAVLVPSDTDLSAFSDEQAREISLLIADPNPRRRFAQMAAYFFGAQPETTVAVTGTNGKTSVAGFTSQIWAAAGKAAGSLGTLGAFGPGVSIPGRLTTPDPVRLHGILKQMADARITHLAMEASSHGLDQYRLDGVTLKAAGFTNLTRDHLDYHHSMGAYLRAKTRLFTELLPEDGTAVINRDCPAGAALIDAVRDTGRTVLTYGKATEDGSLPDLALLAAEAVPEGQTLHLSVLGQTASVTVPLVGSFQAYNLLCALGLVIATGLDVQAALAALPQIKGIPGRMEFVGSTASGAGVVVDYAHTPDALETALTALRPHASGKLAVVFGCGGDRDAGKRLPMGEIAFRLADTVIVTDDNPRTEDPTAIREQVMAGCPYARDIADRRNAIAEAMAGLQAGDVLLVAGKGHENGQIIGEQTIPFDDRVAVRLLLHETGGAT